MTTHVTESSLVHEKPPQANHNEDSREQESQDRQEGRAKEACCLLRLVGSKVWRLQEGPQWPKG